MKLPKIIRTPDGWLPHETARLICQWYINELEWNGADRESDELVPWITDLEQLQRSIDLGIKGWVSSPRIEAQLAEDAKLWENQWVPWDKRIQYQGVCW